MKREEIKKDAKLRGWTRRRQAAVKGREKRREREEVREYTGRDRRHMHTHTQKKGVERRGIQIERRGSARNGRKEEEGKG